MKTIKYILVGALAIVFGCNGGIDPITPVEPGADETAPVVTIDFPVAGTKIELPEEVSSVNIQFEVSDDIEVGTIEVMYDDTEIGSFNSFIDYRRTIKSLVYDNVTYGNHTVTVTATDLDGKSTTASVDFEKAPPYIPKYDGEIFYLPFDGEYMDMISFKTANVVGTPGFANESVVGPKSYQGATDSYLTFPTEGLQNQEFSAIFWMKVNAVPDRAGILVMGPVDEENPDAMNNRTGGFRFFRENAGGKQRFKLNVGTGDGETWIDGGSAADVDPTIDEWVHFAFTISPTKAVVYIDGQVVKEGDFAGIDWTGCDLLSIMSGVPRFEGWDHTSDLSLMDELRIFNKTLTQEEIQNIITEESGKDFTYTPKYDGEIFYMPFEDSYLEYVSQADATTVGTPGFEAGKVGQAYKGSADSYLTFPTDGLLGTKFSASFWLKINATPDRAGILIAGPEDTDNPEYPDMQNDRTSGFRFFRENAGGNQRFKLNAGNGTTDVWFDGGETANVDPTTGNWVHFAFTISDTESVVYIDGEVVAQGDFSGVDWTGCDILSIMSGVPRFSEWGHLSDESLMDELRLFNKALTQEEVQTIMGDDN